MAAFCKALLIMYYGIAEILSYYIFLSELTLVFKGGLKCLNLDSK